MANLIELAQQFLTSDNIGKVAGLLGESSGTTGKLLGGAVPLLLGAMGGSASPSGIEALVRAISPGGAVSPSMLDGLSGLLGDNAAAHAAIAGGGGLLASLFGSKTDLITRALAGYAGTNAGAAKSTLGLVTPLLAALIGKQLAGAGQPVSVATVNALLHDNHKSALVALPDGLKSVVHAIPGLSGLFGAAAVGGYRKRRSLLLLLLGLLGLIGLLWWINGHRGPDVATCNAQFREALVGNTINFDTADASIAADSKELLGKLAAVANSCKAYKIEVSGHTDTVGDEAMNFTLSQQRAATVANYLASQGVPSGQLTAVGFGSTRPVVPTGDEVPNAANRRIEFTVSN